MSKPDQLLLIVDEPDERIELPPKILERIIQDLAELILHSYSNRRGEGSQADDNRL